MSTCQQMRKEAQTLFSTTKTPSQTSISSHHYLLLTFSLTTLPTSHEPVPTLHFSTSAAVNDYTAASDALLLNPQGYCQT